MRNYKDIRYPETVELLNKCKGYHTDINCPDCDGHLVVREGHSKFLGCSNYPNCKTMIGFQQPKLPRPDLLCKEMFSNNSIDGWQDDDGWEEVIDEMYPAGVHCKDDF